MTDDRRTELPPDASDPGKLSRRRLLPFLHDVVGTGISSAITAISLVLVTAITARMLTTEDFGAFAFARQIAMTLVPLASLSLDLALTRYVALNPGRAGYVYATVVLATGAATLFLIVGWINAVPLGLLLFDYPGADWIIRTMLLLVAGTTAFRLLYAIRRSSGRIHMANVLKVVILGLVPIAAALATAPSGDPALVIGSIGVGMLVFTLPIFRDAIQDKRLVDRERGRVPFKLMLAYGVPRMPGGLLRAGLFSVGLIFAPHMGGMNTVANLAIGFYAVRLAEALLGGFRAAALHRVSHALNVHGEEYVRNRSEDILGFAVAIGLYVATQLFVWADELVMTWVGPDYAPAIPLVQGMSIGITPYLVYVLLRSVLDSIETKAVNTLNLLIAFCCVTVLSFLAVALDAGPMGLVAAFVVGVSVLGISTTAYLYRKHGLRLRPAGISQSILMAGVFGILSYLADSWIHDSLLGGQSTIVVFIIVQSTLGILFIATARYTNARWFDQLWRRLPKRITARFSAD